MLDLDKMLAEAAAAAEDSGENLGNEKPKAKAQKEEPKVEVQTPVEETVDTPAVETKVEDNHKKLEEERLAKEKADKLEQEQLEKERLEKEKADKLEQERLEKEEQDRIEKERLEKEKAEQLEKERLAEQDRIAREEAKRKAQLAAASKHGLTETSIEKILAMNTTYSKFDAQQKTFVAGYFQLETENVSSVIFKALTESERNLTALNKIVTSKSLEAAERAFFLMSLENHVIEDVYEQLDILTGGLGPAGTVTAENKLKVCMKVESAISSMDKDVFTYIERLQQFTDIVFLDGDKKEETK